MSLYDLLGRDFWLWIMGSVILAGFFKFVINAQWQAAFDKDPAKTFVYEIEKFTSPINVSITVSGLLIPLVAGLIAYLLINSTQHQIGNMSSLFAGLCSLVFSMCWGVYQSYSLATIAKKHVDLVITKDKNWKTPSDFVAQLSFLLIGVILIVYFLAFSLEVPNATANSENDSPFRGRFNSYRNPERGIVYEILRPQTYVGAPAAEILKKWGTPDATDRNPSEQLTRYTYSSPTATYTISCRDGVVVRFEMQSSTPKGETK